MPGHIYVGIKEEIFTPNIYNVLIIRQICSQFLVAEFNQVGSCGFIGIPITTTVILKFGDF
jgi:hypothetical protein